MKFLNPNNLVTYVASSLVMVALATSQALAITFSFCGVFEDGVIPGGSIDGQIRVDDQGNFDNFASITTAAVDGSQVREYTEINFIGQDLSAIHPSQGISAFKYTFGFGSLPFPDNKFEVYLPASIFPVVAGQMPDLSEFQPFQQYEMRDGILGKDPDDIQVVSEPTSSFSILVALGLGGGLIGRLKKNWTLSSEAYGIRAFS